MPAPRWLARMNRRFTNHVMEPVALRLPGFGVIVHKGRKSERTYRTPVNVFRRPGGFVIPLTYGSDAEWVRNVLAAGACHLESRGRSWTLTQPHIQHDTQRTAVPKAIRFFLGLMKVDDFLEMRVEK